jgi:hypothetical protein
LKIVLYFRVLLYFPRKKWLKYDNNSDLLKFRRSQVKKTSLIVLIIAALALAGCKDKPKTEAPAPAAQQGQMPGGAPGAAPGAAPAPGGDPHAGMKAQDVPAGAGKKATVNQTMNSGGYTYVEAADEKGVKVWLALPEIKVAKGDKIEYPEAPPMVNFQSKTLNRTFEKILFVPGIRIVK